jgi:hypothetical protein
MTLVGMRRRTPERVSPSRRGAALPSLYSDVLHEPLHDMIAELLRQLDQQKGTDSITAVVGCG